MINLRPKNVDGVGIAEWLCYFRRDRGLQELREWVGDEGLLRFISLWPGLYLRIPSSKDLLLMALDLELVDALTRLRTARRAKDLKGVIEGEQAIARISRKLGRKYVWGYKRARELVRELPKIKSWNKDLETYRKKVLSDCSN